jgi:hypothetical protein
MPVALGLAVLPRQDILELVLGPDHPVGTSALDVLANSFRGEVEAPYHKKLVGSTRGLLGVDPECATTLTFWNSRIGWIRPLIRLGLRDGFCNPF